MKQGPLANEQAQHVSAKADAAYTRQMTNDMKTIVATPEGRRFFARLIFNICGVMVSPAWSPSAEVHVQAGKRMVGEQLLGMLELRAPAETRRLVDEWFKDRFEWRTEAQRESKKSTSDGDD